MHCASPVERTRCRLTTVGGQRRQETGSDRTGSSDTTDNNDRPIDRHAATHHTPHTLPCLVAVSASSPSSARVRYWAVRSPPHRPAQYREEQKYQMVTQTTTTNTNNTHRTGQTSECTNTWKEFKSFGSDTNRTALMMPSLMCARDFSSDSSLVIDTLFVVPSLSFQASTMSPLS